MPRAKTTTKTKRTTAKKGSTRTAQKGATRGGTAAKRAPAKKGSTATRSKPKASGTTRKRTSKPRQSRSATPNKPSAGVVILDGREYKTVALRVQEFRDKYPPSKGWGINTNALGVDKDTVIVVAKITDPKGNVVASGLAEESRDSGGFNDVAALEVCETSAIGRALAAFGLAGTEYASADEVQNAQRARAAKAGVGSNNEAATLTAVAAESEPKPEREEASKFIGYCEKTDLTAVTSSLAKLNKEFKAEVVQKRPYVLEEADSVLAILADRIRKELKAGTPERHAIIKELKDFKTNVDAA